MNNKESRGGSAPWTRSYHGLKEHLQFLYLTLHFFISFKIACHRCYIFSKPNFPIISSFKIFLKFVKFSAKFSSFLLEFVKFLLRLLRRLQCVFFHERYLLRLNFETIVTHYSGLVVGESFSIMCRCDHGGNFIFFVSIIVLTFWTLLREKSLDTTSALSTAWFNRLSILKRWGLRVSDTITSLSIIYFLRVLIRRLWLRNWSFSLCSYTRNASTRLCFCYVLFESLIVHVYLSHWFFFDPRRRTLESLYESLVIVFKLVFYFFLFLW
jgi:hypothetical protein